MSNHTIYYSSDVIEIVDKALLHAICMLTPSAGMVISAEETIGRINGMFMLKTAVESILEEKEEEAKKEDDF